METHGGTNQPGQNLRTINVMREEAEQRLGKLNLAPMDPVMAQKAAPGVLSIGQIQVSTNVFGMVLPKCKPVYRYSITIIGEFAPHIADNGSGSGHGDENENGNNGNGIGHHKQLEFTGRVSGDPNCVTRRDDCRKIFHKCMELNKEVFCDKNTCYFYDLKAILFTLQPLKLKDENVQEFELPTGPEFYSYMQKVVVTVQKVTEKFNLTLGDFKSYVSSDLALSDHSLQQFLEIAIAQPVLNDPTNHVVINGGATYFMDPTAFGFSERDSPALKEGKYLAIGAQKSVRLVEGPKGRGNNNVATIIETKKTPFHSQQLLIEKFREMVRLGAAGQVNGYDLEGLRRGIKGLYVQTTHRTSNRLLRIQDVLAETPRTSILTENERYGAISIERYFQDRYNLTLQYPDAPLIGIREQKSPGLILKFPVEVLRVVDNQRVTTDQQSREQISQQIRACAVMPCNLKDQIMQSANAIGLFTNAHLSEAEIKVINVPLQTNARVLPAPQIIYASSNARPDGRGTWRGDMNAKFLLPATCKKWAAFLINPNARDAIDERTMTDMIRRLVTEATRRGMTLPEPVKIGTVEATEKAMHAMVDTCVNNGVEFAFFVHAGNDTNIHGFMKYFELKGIVTQDCKAQTASKVVIQNQNLTMENIVMKTNCKLGGLNWEIKLNDPSLEKMLDPRVLYIGFGQNHPGGGLGGLEENAPPTVVGFAANDNPHHFEFTGDWVYQTTRRDEKVDVIKDIIEKILDRFKANRNCTPKCLVIYRNGCSEGQFADVISYEIPLIKAAMKNKDCDDAKLVVIVPNKLHNLRIIPAEINRNDRAPEQNVKPGMIVDTNLVHPAWNEFYLCSHTTLQGTAKVPRYTVLYDDSELGSDQIQEATYALAYGYQIVKSPTSLPAPAYIAIRYAERGRTMFKSHMASETATGRRGTSNEELNAEITLNKHDWLRQTRINA